MFGNGDTACRPISEADLARFVADCLDDGGKHDRILPVGGPGHAVTARERGAMLFELTGRYDDAATPAYGQDTLRAFYERAIREGLAGQELGDQALF